tara:strand:- start:346 stop:603 length:258 start_codon:yes stop_codon:yes gene_type:complete
MIKNNFQKGFMQGCGCAFGFLSCPLIIFSAWSLINPVINSLIKDDYIKWNSCRIEASIYNFSDQWKKYISPEEECGKRPKKWKWQ